MEQNGNSPNEKMLDAPFPWLKMTSLCIGMLAHSIVFTSPMPFVAFMVVDFKIASSLDSAGYWAGWITGTFMLGRTIAGIPWGFASDKWGRKPCLLLSMFNVFVFGILFGFSTNFTMAVASRFAIGLGNGFMGVAKVCVTEIVTNKDHEMKGFGMLNGIWGLGLIVGPAIGGILSRPAVQYPSIFSSSGIWGVYPYLLPTVVSGLIALVAFLSIYFFLDETLIPKTQNHNKDPETSSHSLSSTPSHVEPSILKLKHSFLQLIATVRGTSSSSTPVAYDELSTSSSHGITDNESNDSLGDEDDDDEDSDNVTIQLSPLSSVHSRERRQIENEEDCHKKKSENSSLSSWIQLPERDSIDEFDTKTIRNGNHFRSDDVETGFTDPSDEEKSSMMMVRLNNDSNTLDDSSINDEDVVSSVVTTKEQKPSTFLGIIHDRGVIVLLMVYLSFCFIVTNVDESLPLWAVTSLSEEGLGFSSAEVGELLGAVGFGLIVFQVVLFEILMKSFKNGPADVIYRMALSGAFALLLTPIMATLTVKLIGSSDISSVLKSIALHLSIFIPMLLFRCSVVIIFATLSVIVNGSVAQEMRGTINGLVMVAGSAGNAFGPIIGSVLYASLVDAPRPLDGRYLFPIVGILLFTFGYVVKWNLKVNE